MVEMRGSVGCWERCNPGRLSVGGIDAVSLRDGEDMKGPFSFTSAGTSLPTLGGLNIAAKEVCMQGLIFFSNMYPCEWSISISR